MTDRPTIDQITSDQLDTLYDQLAALRQIARGYCPECGRGDAAPTVADWERERQRADTAERAAVARVSDLYEQWVKAGPPPLGTLTARWWDARLVELHDAIRPPTDQTKEQQ